MSSQTAAMMQLQKLLGLSVPGRAPLRIRGFGDDAVTTPSMWSDPYSNQPATNPPLVATQDTGSGNTAQTIGTAVGATARGLLNLFATPSQYPPGYVPPQPTPLWVYALVGVGGVVAVGFIARSLRTKRSVAGYRRRHRR